MSATPETVEDLRELAGLATQQRRLERVELSLVRTIVDVAPIPMWVKRLETRGRFRMLFVNPAYERQWGIASSDYAGKLDVDVWPREAAEAFRANDQRAVDSAPAALYTTELVPTFASPVGDGGTPIEWNICKVAVDSGASVLVAGIAWPVETIQSPPSGKKNDGDRIPS